MQTKIGQLNRSIAESFSRISKYLTLTNGLGYTDFNSDAERFFINILNVTYGYALRDANIEKPNFPAIDLVDDRRRVCFQITTSGTNKKFSDTIRIYKKYKHDEKYDDLFFLILDTSHSITSTSKDIRTKIISLTRLLRDISKLPDNDIEYLDSYIREFLRERDDSGLPPKKGITFTLGNAKSFIEWSEIDSSDAADMLRDLKNFAEKISNLTNQQRAYVHFLVTYGHNPKSGHHWNRSDNLYIPTALEQQHYKGLEMFNSLKALDLVHLDDDYDQHNDERYVTALVISYRGIIEDFNYIAQIKAFLNGNAEWIRRVFINCDFTPLN